MRARIAGLAGILLALGCASQPSVSSLTTDAGALEAYRTRRALETHLGPAAGCFPSRSGFELCGWLLSSRQEAWEPIARSIDTRLRLNLLCELPLSGSPRAPQSCSLHRRRALPFEVALTRAPKGPEPSPAEGAQTRDERAREALARATDVVALGRLVGALPSLCLQSSERDQVCRWSLTGASAGYRLMAAIAGAERRLVLECQLPLDGSPRAPDACSVRVGA